MGGIVVGFVVASVLTCGLGYAFVKKKEKDVRLGWNLVPVVVAAQDIPEDTVITFDMMSQRSVPEQFVTPSVVKPAEASSIVNQPVRAQLLAGDPFLWSQFAKGNKPSSAVLVAAHDVRAGAPLKLGDLTDAQLPDAWVTASFIHKEDAAQLVGKQSLVPFRTGDPILWTSFPSDGGR